MNVCGIKIVDEGRPGVVDRSGQKFGRLTVLYLAPRTTWRRRMAEWVCECSCGKWHQVCAGSLTQNLTQSCGCLNRDQTLEMNANRTYPRGEENQAYKHGQSQSAAFHSWANMRQRCSNPNHPRYGSYGGRGITVCPEWNDRDTGFAQFLADMGERPDWATGGIDRIDNDGPYAPWNCRWATASQQNANQRPRRNRKAGR